MRETGVVNATRGVWRAVASGRRPLVEFLGRLITEVPPERDPYLRGVQPVEQALVRAGLGYQVAGLLAAAGESERAARTRDQASGIYEQARAATVAAPSPTR